MSKIYISTFRSTKDIYPNQPPEPLDWSSIVTKFSIHLETATKEEVLLWSPTKYPPGVTRANRNVELISCAVMDYDGTHEWSDVKEKLDSYEFTYLAHSTFSNNLDHPCFRLILPLDKPLTQHEWPNAWRRVYGVFGGDKQTSDIARIYYLPSHPKGSDSWVCYS